MLPAALVGARVLSSELASLVGARVLSTELASLVGAGVLSTELASLPQATIDAASTMAPAAARTAATKRRQCRLPVSWILLRTKPIDLHHLLKIVWLDFALPHTYTETRGPAPDTPKLVADAAPASRRLGDTFYLRRGHEQHLSR